MSTFFNELAATVQQQWPDSKIDIKVYPSGSAKMWVILAARLLNIEYLPGHGFGVSVVPEGAEGWLRSHDFVTGDENTAKQHFLYLLENADSESRTHQAVVRLAA